MNFPTMTNSMYAYTISSQSATYTSKTFFGDIDSSIRIKYKTPYTLKRTANSKKAHVRVLSENQLIGAVLVTYDGTDTFLTASKNSVLQYFKIDSKTKKATLDPHTNIVDRYGWGSGIFSWSIHNKDLRIAGWKNQLSKSKTGSYDMYPIHDKKNPNNKNNWRDFQLAFTDSSSGESMRISTDLDGWGVQQIVFNMGSVSGTDDLVFSNAYAAKDTTRYSLNIPVKYNNGVMRKVTNIQLFLPVNARGAYDRQLYTWQSGFLWANTNNSIELMPDMYAINSISVVSNKVTGGTKIAVPFVGSEFEAIPFTHPTKEVLNIPDFIWDLKQSKYIINYWGQIGFYGFRNDLSTVYRPTQYLSLSNINNPLYTPNTKVLDAFDKNNKPITAAVPWKDNLIVFTDSSTSLFVGRIPESKKLIHPDIGVSYSYRDTVKVVSDSIVFKNKSSVYAYVPTPGTEGSASLRIRDIGKTIKAYLEDIESNNEYTVLAETVDNGDYWLIYKLKDKTIIFKYRWADFSWMVDEYDVALSDFIKIDNSTLVARDSLGTIYKFMSDEYNSASEVLVDSVKFLDNLDENKYPTDANYKNFILDVKHKIDPILTSDWKTLSLLDIKGPWQDLIRTKAFDFVYKKGTSEYNYIQGNLRTSLLFISAAKQKPISYELQLGPRRPSVDTNIIMDDATVIIGNSGDRPVTNQNLTIITDGHILHEFPIDIKSNTTAISAGSVQNKWSFGSSEFQTPLSKHTKKIRKSLTSFDLRLKGDTTQKLSLDAMQFRYRKSGRKNYSR